MDNQLLEFSTFYSLGSIIYEYLPPENNVIQGININFNNENDNDNKILNVELKRNSSNNTNDVVYREISNTSKVSGLLNRIDEIFDKSKIINSNVTNYLLNNNFKTVTAELSLFDPIDEEGKRFFVTVLTPFCNVEEKNSVNDYLSPYLKQMGQNLNTDENKIEKRNPIIPDESLYELVKWQKKIPNDKTYKKLNNQKFSLFVGVYSIGDNIIKKHKNNPLNIIKENINNFTSQYIGNIKPCNKSDNELTNLNQIYLFPIFRPSSTHVSFADNDKNTGSRYRGGGLFLYGEHKLIKSDLESKQNQETNQIIDFPARIISQLYKSTVEVVYDQTKEITTTVQSAIFSHEMKNYADAISTNWLVEPDDRLVNEIRNSPLWVFNDQVSDEKWKIALIPKLYDEFSDVFKYWLQLNEPKTHFGSFGMPNDIRGVIQHAFNTSKYYLKSRFFNNKKIHDKFTYNQAINNSLIIDKLWEFCPKVETNNFSLIPDWESKNSKYWLILSRTITAIFNNCIRYSHPYKDISAIIEILGNNIILTVSNYRDTKDHDLESKFKNIRDKLDATPMAKGVSGQNIFRYISSGLEANFELPDPDSNDPKYTVKMTFPISKLGK